MVVDDERDVNEQRRQPEKFTGGCARLAGPKAVTPPEQSEEGGECTGREQHAREVPKKW